MSGGILKVPSGYSSRTPGYVPRGSPSQALYHHKVQVSVERSQSLCDRGWKLIKRKKFLKAYEIFKKAIEKTDTKNPGIASIKMGLAVCEGRIGHFESAQSYLLEVKRDFPSRTDAADYILARGYQHQGQYREAVNLFNRLLIRSPSSTKYLSGLGHCYEAAERLDEAAKQFQKLIDLEPEKLEWRTTLGRCYKKMQNMQAAIKALEEAKQKCHLDSRVVLPLVECYQLAGDFNRAKALLESVVKHPSLREKFLPALAMCHMRQGRIDEGIEMLQTELKSDPRNIHLVMALICLYRKKRAFSNSFLIHPELQKTHSKYKEVILSMTKCLADLGKDEKVLDTFDLLIKCYPGDMDVLLQKAKFHLNRGEGEAAREILMSLDKKFPRDPEVLRAKARYFMEIAKPDVAIKYFSDQTKQFPYRVEGWLGLLFLSRQLKGPAAAIKIFEEELKARISYHPKLFDAVAKCYYQEGLYQEAIRYLQTIRKRSPYFINAFDGLNICYEATEEMQKRREILEEGLRTHPYNLRLHCEYVRYLLDEGSKKAAKGHKEYCLKVFSEDPYIGQTLHEVFAKHWEENNLPFNQSAPQDFISNVSHWDLPRVKVSKCTSKIRTKAAALRRTHSDSDLDPNKLYRLDRLNPRLCSTKPENRKSHREHR